MDGRSPTTLEVPEPVSVSPRPSLRGTFHRWSVPIAITLTVLLAIRVGGPGARAAVLVYGVAVTAMLFISGVYHSRRLAERDRRLLRRVDHSMILVGIGGTYTAVIVLALSGAEQTVLLSIAGALTLIGVMVRMRWLDAPPWVVTAVYLVAGWQVLLDFPAYASALTGGQLALIAVGGGLYSLGAVVYALKRPNPWPTVFGYHEIFHAFVVAAAFSHWLAIWSLAG